MLACNAAGVAEIPELTLEVQGRVAVAGIGLEVLGRGQLMVTPGVASRGLQIAKPFWP